MSFNVVKEMFKRNKKLRGCFGRFVKITLTYWKINALVRKLTEKLVIPHDKYDCNYNRQKVGHVAP